jgi:hypothetical protein
MKEFQKIMMLEIPIHFENMGIWNLYIVCYKTAKVRIEIWNKYNVDE